MMQILAQKNFAGLIDVLEPIAIRAHTWTRNYEAEHNLSPLPPLGIRPSTVPTAKHRQAENWYGLRSIPHPGPGRYRSRRQEPLLRAHKTHWSNWPKRSYAPV